MKKLVSSALLFSPFLAFAEKDVLDALPASEGGRAVNNLFDVVYKLGDIVSVVTPFIIGLAVLVIIWGIFNYIMGAGDEEKRGEAKQYIIWGIIGVFVMVSIWGLIGIVKNTANIKKQSINSPQVVPCAAGLTGIFNTLTNQWECKP